ncbi:MAG: Uma2 family endonuclease [Acidobacteria bacterium]|nr:Uma2 family endonuclease [Acidobacteriota bacterium]
MALPQPLVPVLENGDRMDRDEFVARWDALPWLQHAELIKGVVYLPSPVSASHGEFDFLLGGWLAHYRRRTPGCSGATNASWELLSSMPQPDLALRWLPEYGGKAVHKGRFLAGPPDLIIEICASSRSYDLGPKLALYREAGVREYLAVLVAERRIEWRFHNGTRYTLLKRSRNGIYKSNVFPGLWLDEAAMWRDDCDRLIECLEEGLKVRNH